MRERVRGETVRKDELHDGLARVHSYKCDSLIRATANTVASNNSVASLPLLPQRNLSLSLSPHPFPSESQGLAST